MPKPVLLLAFANARPGQEGYLRNLPDELNRLRAALEPVVAEGLCEIELLPNATLDDLIASFQKPRLRDRIALFHYAGHAESYELLLEEAGGALKSAHGAGLVPFLGSQRGLSLVFLNGCFSAQQALGLTAAGIPAVIGTVQAVNDGIATALSTHFYRVLAHGGSLGQAWREATYQVQAQHGTADLNRYYVAEGGADRGIRVAEKRNQFPWELYLRPGAADINQWNLPDAAGNPYFGLPPIPASYDFPAEPYRFLARYRREDARVFFGRGAVVRDLYHRLSSERGAPLLLFFGQSGVGKSSVLEAGLMPRLEGEFGVSYLRRDPALGLAGTLRRELEAFTEMPPTAGAKPLKGDAKNLDQTIAFLEGERRRYDGRIAERIGQWIEELKRDEAGAGSAQESSPPPGQGPAPAAGMGAGRKRIIILDQVEEVFTKPMAVSPPASPEAEGTRQGAELDEFLNLLSDLFQSPSAPPFRLVLSYRKEYDPEIEKALRGRQLPLEKVFLDKPDRQGVEEIVLGLTSNEDLRRRYPLYVEPGLPGIIADNLLADPDSPVAPVLQIILTKLWQLQSGQLVRRFTIDDYHRLREQGILLQDFFEQQMQALSRWAGAGPDSAAGSGLALDVLYGHTTELGTAGSRRLEELRLLYQHRADQLDKLLLEFKELYLLAETAGGQTSLVHDTLAPIVQRALRDSDRPGQRALRVLTSKMSEYVHDPNALLDPADLKLVERGAGGMRVWEPAERELVERSRKRRFRLRAMRFGLLGMTLVLVVGGGLFLRQRKELQERREVSRLSNLAQTAAANADPAGAWRFLQEALALRPDEPSILQLRHNLYSEFEFYRQDWRFGTAPTHLAYLDSATFVAAAGDTLFRVAKDGKPEVMALRSGLITALDYSPLTERLVVGDESGRLMLWTAQGEPLLDWEGSMSAINAVAFSPDGSRILTGNRDGMAVLWDSQRDYQLLQLPLHPDEVQAVAFFGNDKLITGCRDGLIRIWDTTGAPIDTLAGHSDQVLCLAISPAGNILASGGRDGRAILWDLNTGREAARLLGHTLRVNDLCFSPDGQYLLTVSDDRTARLWDGKGFNLRSYRGHQGYVYAAAFSPTGQELLSAGEDRRVARWPVESKVQHRLGPQESAVSGIALLPGGRYLLTGAGGGEREAGTAISDPGADFFGLLEQPSAPRQAGIWDLESGRLVSRLTGHHSGINAVAASRDGATLATAGDDSTVILWNREGAVIRTLKGHHNAVLFTAFSPNGRFLLSGGKDSSAVIWDIQNLSDDPSSGGRQALSGSGSLVSAGVFTPNSRQVVTAGYDGRLRWWDRKGRPLRTLSAHESRIETLAISPDGRHLLTGSADNTARLWTSDGELLLTFAVTDRNKTGGQRITCVAFSPDGRYLALGTEGGSAKICRLSGQEISTFTVLEQTGIYSLAFSDDSRRLIVGDGKGYLRVLGNIDVAAFIPSPSTRRAPSPGTEKN